MKIESQVCRLELAKRLLELGVEQESYWSWYQGVGGCWFLGDPADTMNNAVEISHATAPHFNRCAAFTVAELGEMLPPAFSSSRGADGQWMCVNEMKSNSEGGKSVSPAPKLTHGRKCSSVF